MDISECRGRIDAIDAEIIKLFAERMKIALAVADYKREHGLPTLDEGRENAVLDKARKLAAPELGEYAAFLFRELMLMSRAYQNEARPENIAGRGLRGVVARALASAPDSVPASARVACQGVAGAWSHAACRRLFERPETVFFRSFEDVCRAVSSGDCDCGVLPAENSSFGSVVEVYDLMAKYDFYITRSLRLPVAHCLLARRGETLGGVREVLSHPQAIGQCAAFLAAHPEISVRRCENTAIAAREVAEGGPGLAAIASRECAELYGLDVLAEGICDSADNYTRFICIAREPVIYPGASRVSMLTELRHRPGSLCELLSRFLLLGLNLTKIESRPIPGRGGEYRFICDIEATVRDADVTRLLEELAAETESFKFLGCYTEG